MLLWIESGLVARTALFVSFLLSAASQQIMDVSPAAELKRLRTDLLKDYDRQTRPVRNQSAPLKVKIFFDVTHIVALDEKYQTLTVRGQLMMKWTDEFLTWDLFDYSGLTSVRFPPKEIWVPDIHSIYNVKAVSMFSQGGGSPLIVSSDGAVKWYPTVVFDVPCSADYRHYPFDGHLCSILFGAWTHSGDAIVLEALDVDSRSSCVGTEWRLQRVSQKNEMLGVIKYYMVRVELELKRVSRIYRYISLLPTLSTILTSLFGFWLLPKETSRYLVGFSNVILTSLLLQYLAVTVPAGKDIPILAQYSAACLCMSGVFVAVTVLAHLLGNSTGPVPKPLARLTRHLWVDRYLCLLAYEDSSPETTAPPGEEQSRERDWKRISLVLDRMSFCAFLAIYVVLLGVLVAI